MYSKSKMMRNTTLTTILSAAFLLPAAWAEAQTAVPGVSVRDVRVERNDAYVAVGMTVDLSGLEVRSDRAVLLTPSIVNGKDTLSLTPVGIYGRQRYYHYIRNGESMLGGTEEISYLEKKAPSDIEYHTVVPYSDWMNGSELILTRKDYGCCSNVLGRQSDAVGAYKSVEYVPVFRYMRPVAEAVKTRSLAGRAFIDFPVNRTELHPDYRNNPVELAKITATIDSVRNDRDVTVTALAIKGYASPEGTYENNIRLAKGRTETLKNHVQQLYRFEPGFIVTDYEPEDWEGLRRYVEGSGLAHKAEILGIIDDTTLDPDAKDWRIKLNYSEEYSLLLSEVYPALRHSDYSITYTVRGYSDPEEIREVMAKTPQKLSLNEMFILAQSLEEGSDEYNEVFETAVRMYPGDLTANLNAANAAMMRKDYVSAARYLDKSGDSAEAVYARGVLAALNGDYDSAEAHVREAMATGMEDADGILAHLEEVKKYSFRKE